MSSRKRNLLSGGPKSAPKTTASKKTSTPITTSTSVINSLRTSTSKTTAAATTRQSSSSQRTIEPFAFTQTRSTAAAKSKLPPAIIPEEEDDDIQIIEEPQPKRRNRRKSSDDIDIKEDYIIPDSMTVPTTTQAGNKERQGTPFNSIQNRKERKSAAAIQHEVIPDSIAEVVEDESFVEQNSSKSAAKNKRTPKQAGLDEGIGETLKAVKKIKLSTPTPSTTTTSLNDLRNASTKPSLIRSAPPGKQFQKARQGSFYVSQPTQRISINDMSVWTGN